MRKFLNEKLANIIAISLIVYLPVMIIICFYNLNFDYIFPTTWEPLGRGLYALVVLCWLAVYWSEEYNEHSL